MKYIYTIIAIISSLSLNYAQEKSEIKILTIENKNGLVLSGKYYPTSNSADKISLLVYYQKSKNEKIQWINPKTVINSHPS